MSTPDPDRDVSAGALHLGARVKHRGQQCTVIAVRKVNLHAVHITLSNGVSVTVRAQTPIGVYDA